MGVHRQVFFLLTVLTPMLIAYPYQPIFDPIDLCILACDNCYKAHIGVVLKCSNECISTGGKVGTKWSTGCSSFNNPFDINIED